MLASQTKARSARSGSTLRAVNKQISSSGSCKSPGPTAGQTDGPTDRPTDRRSADQAAPEKGEEAAPFCLPARLLSSFSGQPRAPPLKLLAPQLGLAWAVPNPSPAWPPECLSLHGARASFCKAGRLASPCRRGPECPRRASCSAAGPGGRRVREERASSQPRLTSASGRFGEGSPSRPMGKWHRWWRI